MSPEISQMHSVVISGASNGIGAALALAYARPGVCLGLLGRHADRLSQVQSRCEAQGAVVEIGLIDVTDGDSLRAWLLAFDQRHPVDLLIANAGVAQTQTSLDEGETWEDIQRQFGINTLGTLNTLHPLVEPMLRRRHGQIGIVSSLSAYVGMPISPAYCGSKAATKVYGEALRGWLAPKGVGVSVICPGFVQTDMSDRFPGPTPFRVSAARAARIIQRGLSHNRARIAFPLPLALGMWFLSILPPSISLWLQKRFGFY